VNPPEAAGGADGGALWDAVGRLVGRTLATRRRRGFRVVAVRDDRVLVCWTADEDLRRTVPRRVVEDAWVRARAGRPPRAGLPLGSVVAALVEAAEQERRVGG